MSKLLEKVECTKPLNFLIDVVPYPSCLCRSMFRHSWWSKLAHLEKGMVVTICIPILMLVMNVGWDE